MFSTHFRHHARQVIPLVLAFWEVKLGYLLGKTMRCIFCKLDSANSTSVEHIIPESLWNTKQILPRGVVCDKCNNYFSRKVERQFLCSPEMESLRFHQAIPSKKGRVPPIMGAMLGSEVPISIRRVLSSEEIVTSIELNEDQVELVRSGQSSKVYFPIASGIPTAKITSRFLAKVALEALAQRLLPHYGGVDYVVEEEQFDLVREHARYGRVKEWPYYVRRIYDADLDEKIHGLDGQKVHEYDFLHTDHGEFYFVLALYGVELTINIGGPCIEGYETWLKENDNASPLYWGKNAEG